MCWSGEVSATLAVAGFASAAYGLKKGEPKAICVTLAFFALMELIQAYSYTVVDQCTNTANTRATQLAYLHIALQPFFFNAVSMHFIPEHIRRRIRIPVYSLCVIASLAILARILPIEWQYYCYNIQYKAPFHEGMVYRIPFCGQETCTTSGEWHLKWQIVAGYNWWLDRAYFISVFLFPLIYGSWRALLYGTLTGPVLVGMITTTSNEFAAVWCGFSVAILIIMFNTPVRRLLYVKSYYGFWREPRKPGY